MKRFTGKFFLSACILAIIAGTAFALPPSRHGPVDPRTGRYVFTWQKAPVFPKELLQPRLSTERGKYPYSPKALAAARAAGRLLAINPAPVSPLRPLVVLIDFTDKEATRPHSEFVPLFFDSADTALSVANYWEEVSYGKFTMTGSAADIIGWIRPGRDFTTTITTYAQITDPVRGVDTDNLSLLIRDIVTYLDPATNFALYADPATGVVQSLILVHAGTGREETNDNTALYSHQATVGPYIADGVEVRDYIAVPELLSFDPGTGVQTPTLIAPGVIVHEMGHLLGLPDLYPVSGTEGQVGAFSGVGVFDLMGFGMWGSNFLDRPDNPSHLSAWSKDFLGWLTPALRTQTTDRTLPPVELLPQADKVYSNTSADPGQYFLVENRQVSSTLGTWLFDKFLLAPTGGGAGVLVWQIDNAAIVGNPPIGVNVDSAFRGVYIKEADGVYDMALPIPDPLTSTANDRAKYYGLEADYFNENPSAGQPREFSRTQPSAAVNSSPIIDPLHPDDFGTEVRMYGFTQISTGEMDYILDIAVGGGTGALWKTFNHASTARYPLDNAVPVPPEPMRSDDILSIAFDSGNNVWMGSRDQGIFRFLGTRFDFLRQQEGLPAPGAGAPTGATTAPIQVMAFESATGSMWVGTDRGLFKMRDSGSGFRVQSSFTTASPLPRRLPSSDNVQAIAVRRGSDLKYVGTPAGFVRIVDGLTDGEGDDSAGGILSGNVTAIAIDDNGNADIKDDIVWIGFSDGTLVRSRLASEGGPADGDPVAPGDFKTYVLSGSPNVRISSLAVDKNGRLWIGTDSGIQVFDLADNIPDPANPGQFLPNMRDPFNFKGATPPAPETEAFLNFNVMADNNYVTASNNVTGIGFQATTQSEVIAWIGHKADNQSPGGVSRFDANLANDNTTIDKDERLRNYSPIPPNDVPTTFGRSTSVSAVVGDSDGNVWFATSDTGAVRFGNAGVISLDKSNYVNVTAVAKVTLQDDGLNRDNTVAETAVVRVTSTSDAIGFYLTLTETGPDTGVFSGTFGFTNGTTDRVAKLIGVASGDELHVRYVDFNPPGIRTNLFPVKWSKLFPFSDSLFIDDFSCFLSTAAYGSAMAPEVASLRAFRDRYLMGNPVGRTFVDFYYLVSPRPAKWIARSGALQAAARFALAPAVRISVFAVTSSPREKGVVFFLLGVLAAGMLLPWGGKKRGRR